MAFLGGGGGDSISTVLLLVGLDSYVSGVRSISGAWNDASGAQDRYSDSAQRTGAMSSALMAGGAGLITVAAGVGSAFLKSAGNLEATRNGFRTMLGSMEAATAKIEELRDFAKTTPFDFAQSAKGAQQLLAMGVAGQDLIPTMRTVAGAVTAAGGSTEDFLGVLRAWGQIKTKGRVQTEEILQMADRGIPAMRILQKELGLTADQLQNLGNQNIGADVALAALKRGFDKEFGKSLEDGSNSFNNAASNFGDAIEQFKQVAGESILPQATEAIKDLTTLVERAQQFTREHPNFMRFALTFAMVGGGVSMLAGLFLKLRGNALMAAAAKEVLTRATKADSLAELAKTRVAGAEGAAIGKVGKTALDTARNVGTLAAANKAASVAGARLAGRRAAAGAAGAGAGAAAGAAAVGGGSVAVTAGTTAAGAAALAAASRAGMNANARAAAVAAANAAGRRNAAGAAAGVGAAANTSALAKIAAFLARPATVAGRAITVPKVLQPVFGGKMSPTGPSLVSSLRGVVGARIPALAPAAASAAAPVMATGVLRMCFGS
jgi:tape measure domain-containing protein